MSKEYGIGAKLLATSTFWVPLSLMIGIGVHDYTYPATASSAAQAAGRQAASFYYYADENNIPACPIYDEPRSVVTRLPTGVPQDELGEWLCYISSPQNGQEAKLEDNDRIELRFRD